MTIHITSKSLKLALCTFVMALGCASNRPANEPGPAEKAGASVDEGAEKTKDAAKEAGNKVGEETEKAGDKVQEKTSN